MPSVIFKRVFTLPYPQDFTKNEYIAFLKNQFKSKFPLFTDQQISIPITEVVNQIAALLTLDFYDGNTFREYKNIKLLGQILEMTPDQFPRIRNISYHSNFFIGINTLYNNPLVPIQDLYKDSRNNVVLWLARAGECLDFLIEHEETYTTFLREMIKQCVTEMATLAEKNTPYEMKDNPLKIFKTKKNVRFADDKTDVTENANSEKIELAVNASSEKIELAESTNSEKMDVAENSPSDKVKTISKRKRKDEDSDKPSSKRRKKEEDKSVSKEERNEGNHESYFKLTKEMREKKKEKYKKQREADQKEIAQHYVSSKTHFFVVYGCDNPYCDCSRIHGCPRYQGKLARSYTRTKNFFLTEYWYQKAAVQGDENAKESLKKLDLKPQYPEQHSRFWQPNLEMHAESSQQAETVEKSLTPTPF